MRTSTLLLTLFLVLLSGCNQRHSPIEVSRAFWKAVQAGNAGAVKVLVTKKSRASVKTDGKALQIGQVQLGRTVIEGNVATVDTSLVVKSDHPVRVPLQTHLLREEGDWRVDYDATMASLEPGGSLAQALGTLGELGRIFSDKVQESMGDLQQRMPEIKRRIEEARGEIQRQLPEVRRQLEEMLEQLRKGLEQARPVEPPASHPPGGGHAI